MKPVLAERSFLGDLLPRAGTRMGEHALAALLLASAIMVSLSPLNSAYAPGAWGTVALGAVLALASWQFCGRHASRLGPSILSAPLLYSSAGDGRTGGCLSLLDLALLGQIASATTQMIVAVRLPSPLPPLDGMPGISAFYLLLAGVLAFAVIWFALCGGNAGRQRAALLGAGLFSSTLYLRSFAVAEAGHVYVPVFAFTLAAVSTPGAHTAEVAREAWHPRVGHEPTKGRRRFMLRMDYIRWSLIFLGTVLLAAAFSSIPGQSLQAWLELTSTITLAIVLSRSIDSAKSWKLAAWGTVAIAVLLPMALGWVKWLSMYVSFGLGPALAYALDLTELGGSNLIARSVACTLPLSLALTSTASKRYWRWGRWALLAGGVLGVLYTHSWDGLLAGLLALVSYGLIVRWDGIALSWKRAKACPAVRWTTVALVLVALLALATVAFYVAPQLNVFSFGGRFMHWKGAVLAWLDRPWVGNGLGSEAAYTPYTDQVHFLLDTQETRDDPLRVLDVRRRVLAVHAHNLFLELGAGTGLLGIAAFVGWLLTILRMGLGARRRIRGPARAWIAGCLAGIVGALAWGTLDVLSVTPPFFSFPVWGLVGLLAAVCDGSWTAERQQATAVAGSQSGDGHRRWLPASLAPVAMVVTAVLSVLLPSLASIRYAAGFVAFQEQRWDDAALALHQVTRFDPLAPRSRQLLAQAYLGRAYVAGPGPERERDLERAVRAYERADALKRGYSPYHSQLGWLAWLGGNVDRAVVYFERAIQEDPGEAWRDGLRANLGLAYAAQGRYAEAISMFSKTLELNSPMAAAPYWRAVQLPDGCIDIVLDPVYVNGASPELDRRILTHLGIANITERQLSVESLAESPISLHSVLDAVEADCQVARAEKDSNAPLLLAALAEASRVAGLHDRAERAYLAFQSHYPSSAYGYRELAMLYREQGRLVEAEEMLKLAVQVSPRDIDSRHNLALVYLDQEMWDRAEYQLDAIHNQSSTTLYRSRLFDPDVHATRARLLLARGSLAQALEARRKVALIRKAPADRLALADLYRQLGQPRQAAGQCVLAAKTLLHAWPRSLDPELWEIGVCLAQEDRADLPVQVVQLARARPLTGNVLLGHAHRARGELEQALLAYRRAAEARPDEGAPYHFLGETYVALGHSQAAEVAYRRAAQLDPWEPLPLLALGRTYWSQGRRDASLESFRAAVEATPGWGQAHTALGNALLAVGDRGGAAEHYQLARMTSGDLQEDVLYDFVVGLAQADVQSPGSDYVRADYFAIDGDQRRVLFAHPESQIRFDIYIGGDVLLVFDIATAPDSWEQPGDGVTFTVGVEPSMGMRRQLFSTYIDPKGIQGDRRWHAHMVDLSSYAGRTVALVLETRAGPAGDDRYDWAAWGTPRLTRKGL